MNHRDLLRLVEQCDNKMNNVDVWVKMYSDGSGELLSHGCDPLSEPTVLVEFDDADDMEKQLKEFLRNG